MRLTLDGLVPAPAQVWGSVRLVPLCRSEPVQDVRIAHRDYRDGQILTVAKVDPRSIYTAYVPYGLVMRWSADGSPEAAVDTTVGDRDGGARALRVLNRMVLRDGPRGFRILPLHLALEGFLALAFGGPDVAWRYWSEAVLREGLSPRSERVVPGASVPGLREALAVFERHPDQCGMLVFVGDQLASATVVGHPDDYAALHDTLLLDGYGTLFAQWGWAFRDVPPLDVQLRGTDLRAIRASLHEARASWSAFTVGLADGLFPADVTVQHVRSVGPRRLVRFATDMRPGREAHIGEALLDASDRVVYLKTFRLDRGQARRGYLLTELVRAGWNLQQLADDQGHGYPERVRADLEAAELGWMLR
ncbi:MAG: hypothetical protein H6736_04360 [Alphaproteobacteria bacterium]|nr:hypothetical protein [Alphaproteobacteria bacterium]